MMDELVGPLQDKLEDWKKNTVQIDKEHAKGKCRNTVQRDKQHAKVSLVTRTEKQGAR